MNSRAKGLRFEREVACRFSELGEVRGLEAGGDHLVVCADGTVYQVEAKDHKILRLPEWLRQQRRDAIPGVHQVLVFKVPRLGVFVVESLDPWLTRAGDDADEPDCKEI